MNKQRRRLLCLLLITLCQHGLVPTGAMALELQDFEDYVWGRAGNGDTIYRVSTGKAYDMASGKVVARLEGLELSRASRSAQDENTVYHLSRSVLLYRHPETDAVLDAYPGRNPEAQTLVSAYSYVDHALVWRLGLPFSDVPPRTLAGSVECERQGPVLHCLRASSYSASAGVSVLEYRWSVDRTAPSVEAASRAEFAETEPPNPLISKGPVLLRLSSYRAASWKAVPSTLRDWVQSEAPGFGVLPKDTAQLIHAAGFEN